MVSPDPLAGLPDRYELRRHLADGGMGSVWCAHDRRLSRRVAIKVMAGRFAGDAAAVRRFGREARAAAQLSSHPHVVTIYDVGESEGIPFIVMEFLPGGTVADAMRVGAVTREHALRWVAEAAAALDFAHSRGVLHRDVKPANILLDAARHVQIGDFGIAHLPGDAPAAGEHALLGTAAYLAPEQAAGALGSAASDRYGLGVVAFELLTGRRPFAGESFGEQARQHLEELPPAATAIEPTLSPGVDGVLARALHKRPDERWPSARAFSGALIRAVELEPELVMASTARLAVLHEAAPVPVAIAPPPEFLTTSTGAGGASKPRRPRLPRRRG